MKLPDIEYIRPSTLDEAVRLLAAPDAKVLAGGQSLLPLMAYRLAAPRILVDIGRLSELRGMRSDAHGLVLGALVRWRDIENDPCIAAAHPLLREAVSHVAHYQIRNRGTVGGSLAHADPAAELPAVALACGAGIVAIGPTGRRMIEAADFLEAPLTTALKSDEIIVELRLPPWPPTRRFVFEEFVRRRGDFALAGVCLFYDLDGEGRMVSPCVVAFGATEIQQRISMLEEYLAGRRLDETVCAEAGEMASAAIDAVEDMHAPQDYRRALFGTLVERALIRSMTSGGSHVH